MVLLNTEPAELTGPGAESKVKERRMHGKQAL